jgi:hypothetical protein
VTVKQITSGDEEMSDLTRLFVIVTTAKRREANTDSRMRLVYENGLSQTFELGGQPHDEREIGRTDQYAFSFRPNVDIDNVRSDHFRIVAAGDDAWLPSSIFVIGKSATSQFKVLVGRDNWPDDAWLSTQLSDGNGKAEKARLLDANASPTTA